MVKSIDVNEEHLSNIPPTSDILSVFKLLVKETATKFFIPLKRNLKEE